MFIIYFLNSWSSVKSIVRRKPFIWCFCNLAAKLSQLRLEEQAALIKFERMITGYSVKDIVYDSSIEPFFNEIIVEVS